MQRILIGMGLIGLASYLGRKSLGSLSGLDESRSYIERTLDDLGQFAIMQFPREEIEPGSSPLFDEPDHRMQCTKIAPYLVSAVANYGESSDREEEGSHALEPLIGQAWSSAAQPGQCPKMTIPKWVFRR